VALHAWKDQMNRPLYLSVSQLTRYLRVLMENDFRLQDLWLAGEVSNFSRSAAGHVYFTLKDDASQIRCVLWRSDVVRQKSLPRNGEAIVAHGRVTVYEAQGNYQFYIDTLQPAGIGALHLAFEELKTRLQAEGLFDTARKRPLPTLPRCLGIVTSPQAAALRDILHILNRRYPLIEVVLAPCQVQGDGAPAQIVAALQALQALPEVEVIIVTRGGGSLEELWAFNDERVARAIAESRVPVVSGVGHETDFTIADFVADVRAPTPTAAATLVVPEARLLRSTIWENQRRLSAGIAMHLEAARSRLQHAERILARSSPESRLARDRQQVDALTGRATMHLQHRLGLARERLRSRTLQLASLNPEATLSRGYAIVRLATTRQVVSSLTQVRSGDGIEVQVKDGTFGATVGRQRRLMD